MHYRGDGLTIRHFKNGDEQKCQSLLMDSFSWYLKLEGSEWILSKLSSESILSQSREGLTLVAEEDDLIVGFVHMSTMDYEVGYISVIGVSPESQGKNIGAKLLKRIEREGRNKKLRKIWLMVSHSNTGAINFYLRNGYSVDGVIRDFTLEGLHEMIMSKHL